MELHQHETRRRSATRTPLRPLSTDHSASRTQIPRQRMAEHLSRRLAAAHARRQTRRQAPSHSRSAFQRTLCFVRDRARKSGPLRGSWNIGRTFIPFLRAANLEKVMIANDSFSQYYGELLDGTYDCVDRIVLNAYFPLGCSPGGFRVWWRLLYGADDNLDDTHLMRLAGRFGRRVYGWAKKNKVPVIKCTGKERPH